MEQQPTQVFKVTKGDRTYQLLIPVGAPYGELYDSVFEMLKNVRDLIHTATQAQQLPLPESDKPTA
jgi:hypothetical protein